MENITSHVDTYTLQVSVCLTEHVRPYIDTKCMQTCGCLSLLRIVIATALLSTGGIWLAVCADPGILLTKKRCATLE